MDISLNLTTETVDLAMESELLTVEPNVAVRQVFELLPKHEAGSLLVCHDGVLLGIFTERDALNLMAAGADLDVPIESVMTRTPNTLKRTNTVGAAIQSMASGGYRRLPVVDDEGRPIGIVKVSRIVHYLVEHFPETVYNLPPAPNSVQQRREGA